MLTTKVALQSRLLLLRSTVAAQRNFSAKPPAGAVAPPTETEEAVTVVTQKRAQMTESDKYMIWGKTGELMPPPILPENIAEIAVLDTADKVCG
jgi:hypothetical protein